MSRWVTIVSSVLGGVAVGAAVVQGVHAQAKPPAFMIAEVEVTDAATFQKYGDATRAGIPTAGGRFIVRGGKTFVVSGAPPKQVIVVQWENLEQARAYFESEAYKPLVPIRDRSANTRIFVVEGVAN